MIDPYHDYGLAPDDMPPDWKRRHYEVLADLESALSLLNTALFRTQSEYGDSNDVLERYKKLKAKYAVHEAEPEQDAQTAISYGLYPASARPVI